MQKYTRTKEHVMLAGRERVVYERMNKKYVKDAKSNTGYIILKSASRSKNMKGGTNFKLEITIKEKNRATIIYDMVDKVDNKQPLPYQALTEKQKEYFYNGLFSLVIVLDNRDMIAVRENNAIYLKYDTTLNALWPEIMVSSSNPKNIIAKLASLNRILEIIDDEADKKTFNDLIVMFRSQLFTIWSIDGKELSTKTSNESELTVVNFN